MSWVCRYVPADIETADCADGPKFVAWLQQEGLWRLGGGHARDRRFRHWRDGAHVDFFTVDKVLCELGRTVWEVPSDVWLTRIHVGVPRKKAAA